MELLSKIALLFLIVSACYVLIGELTEQRNFRKEVRHRLDLVARYEATIRDMSHEAIRLRRVVQDAGNLRMCEPCLKHGNEGKGNCIGCRARAIL